MSGHTPTPASSTPPPATATKVSDEIQNYYEAYWANPDEYNDPTGPLRIALLDKLIQLPAESKVLDVGCGRGEFCAYFAKRGYMPTGIDISNTIIAVAKKENPTLDFHAISVGELVPDRAGHFDLVYSSEVIEHLFDVGSYLQAIHQLLKPGGTFVLTTPYHGFVKNVIVDALNYAKHYDPLGQHIRFFNRKSLEACLRQYGFNPTTWTGYGRPWPMWKSFFVVCTKVG